MAPSPCLPGQLLLQLVCGLLPGLTSAVAHLYRVIARAWMLSAIGDCLGSKGLNGLLGLTTPCLVIADANKFALSSHNLCQGLDCCLSTQILFSALG